MVPSKRHAEVRARCVVWPLSIAVVKRDTVGWQTKVAAASALIDRHAALRNVLE